MKKIRKPTFKRDGSTAVQVMQLLNEHPEMSNREIARSAGCSAGYVYQLRKKMAHVPRCPEEEVITKLVNEKNAEVAAREALAEVAYQASRGRQARQADTSVDTILDERGSRYGNFLEHAHITIALKQALHNKIAQRGLHLFPDQIEAIDMICHKLGRIVNGDPHYADSWVDIAGYAKLVADRLEGKSR